MLALPSLVALATAFSTLAAATPVSTFADAAAAHPHGKAAPALAPVVAHAVDQGKEAIKDSYSQYSLSPALWLPMCRSGPAG